MEISNYTVTAGLKRPVRLVLASDLHNRPFRHIIDVISADTPDIIIIAGDLVDRTKPSAAQVNAVAFLEELCGIAPVYFSFGNHEKMINAPAVFNSSNAVILNDTAIKYRDINIGGLASAHGKKNNMPDLNFLEAFEKLDGFKILICHHPEYYPLYIRQKNIDLTLSGHVHGGQIRLFGKGIYAPAQGLFPKLTAGSYENRLFISRGLSNPVPVPRLWNDTELCYIKII